MILGSWYWPLWRTFSTESCTKKKLIALYGYFLPVWFYDSVKTWHLMQIKSSNHPKNKSFFKRCLYLKSFIREPKIYLMHIPFEERLLSHNKVKLSLWSVSEWEREMLFSNFFFRTQFFERKRKRGREQYLKSIDCLCPVVSQRLSPLTNPLEWCHPPSCDRLLQSQAV